MFSSLRKFHPLRVAASAGLKGALPKVLLGAALLGGGGSVLFAGSAQAACEDGSCSFTDWANGGINDPLIIADKKFTYVSSTPIPLGATGTVNGTQPVPGDYLFNFDFDPISPISTFTLNYTAEVTDPHNFFTGVDMDQDVDAFPLDPDGTGPLVACPTTTTAECEYLKTTFTGGTAAVILENLNGSGITTPGNGGGAASPGPSALPVAGSPTLLNVTNVYTSNGGAIDSFVNSYRQGRTSKVPGPLPLLGAGMAFGFSRKLRSRIKTRVQA